MALRMSLSGGALTGSLVYYAFYLDVQEHTESVEHKIDLMTRRLQSVGPARTAQIAGPTPAAAGYHQPEPMNKDEGWNGVLRKVSTNLAGPGRLADNVHIPFSVTDVKEKWQQLSSASSSPSSSPLSSPSADESKKLE